MLFDVDIDVKEGEIVALLGTNGAGKSTLLKAISGVVEADRGAVVSTVATSPTHRPTRSPASGISQMPGGQGVFGSLTVSENLQLAGWTRRRQPDDAAAAIDRGAEMFPVLRERIDVRCRRHLAVASNRCWRWAWPSSPSRGCC